MSDFRKQLQTIKAGTRVFMLTPSGEAATIGHWRRVNGPVKNQIREGVDGWHVIHFDLGGTLIAHETSFRIEGQMNLGHSLRKEADARGIPLRTIEQVQSCIAQCRKQKSDITMARLMLRHGRLTTEAREWLLQEYPQ